MATKLKGLNNSNTGAIKETMAELVAAGTIKVTATTAEFDMDANTAFKIVKNVIAGLSGGNKHPRGSLHAVARRLEEQAKAEFDTALLEVQEEQADTADDGPEHTPDSVTFPDGVKVTPHMRVVYAAMLNGASGTVASICETIGGEYAHKTANVRAALQALKGIGVAQSTPGQGQGAVRPDVWSLVGTMEPEQVQAELAEQIEEIDNAIAELEPSTGVQVAIVKDNQGNERVHAADCADVRKESTKYGYEPYLLTAVTREQVGRDWYSDVASDENEEGSPGWEQSIKDCMDLAMTFLPCCASLLSSETDGPALNVPADEPSPLEEALAVAPELVQELLDSAVANAAQRELAAKAGDRVGYLSVTGLAHTADCNSIKAMKSGKLNIPMTVEPMLLAELLAMVAGIGVKKPVKECRACAKLRAVEDSQQVDVTAFAKWVAKLNKDRSGKTARGVFSGFQVTVNASGATVSLDMRGPLAKQWGRRKDIDPKTLNKAAKELLAEVAAK